MHADCGLVVIGGTEAIGAAYGTAKAGIGIAGLGTFKPELIMKVPSFPLLIPQLTAANIAQIVPHPRRHVRYYRRLRARRLSPHSWRPYVRLSPFSPLSSTNQLSLKFFLIAGCGNGYLSVTVSPSQDYSLYSGAVHLAAGLACGLTGLAAGYAIGIVGDSVRLSLRSHFLLPAWAPKN